MLLELLKRVLRSNLLEELLQVVIWIAISLGLLLFGLFLESVLVLGVGDDSWILLSFDALVSSVDPFLDRRKELLLTVVLNQDVIELEAGHGVFRDGGHELIDDILIFDELHDLSPSLLRRDVLEVRFVIRRPGDHQFDSLLVEFVLELEVIVESTLVVYVQVEMQLIDQVGLVLREHEQVLRQVQPVEPLGHCHLCHGLVVLD